MQGGRSQIQTEHKETLQKELEMLTTHTSLIVSPWQHYSVRLLGLILAVEARLPPQESCRRVELWENRLLYKVTLTYRMISTYLRCGLSSN